MKLFSLSAAAIVLQGAALVTEVAKPGRKRQAQALTAAHNDTSKALSPALARSSAAPGLACGMTTPIYGTAPGSGGSLVTLKTLQECLDLCVATASCMGIISHHHGGQDCYLLGQTYEQEYIPSESATSAYVSNKLAGANCETTYDFLFHGCPRGAGLTMTQRSSSMKIWECQAECDSYADCLAFETNGCLNYPNCGSECWTFHGPGETVIYNGECQTNGDQESYFKVVSTSSPTASPTPPTAAPTASPTPASAPVVADLVGDPHVTNLVGRRFDVHYAGNLMLLQIPRGAGANATLLRLDGHTKQVGGVCAKQLYLDAVNFTGKWVLARNGAALSISARKNSADPTRSRHKQHFQLGAVYIVLSHAKTETGITYLNLHVTNLARVGMPIGGLLGEDDVSWAYAMPAICQTEEVEKVGPLGTRFGSVMVASAL